MKKTIFKTIIFMLILGSVVMPQLQFPQTAQAAIGGPCCRPQKLDDPSMLFSAIDGGTRNCVYQNLDGFRTSEQWLCAPDGSEACNSLVNNGLGLCVAATQPIDPGEGCPANNISTGFGCIPTEPGQFISRILQIGIGVASGVAFLLIVYGSYKVLSAHGNPEGLNSGKETITSAVVGIVFIVLSVTILQVIGLDILGLNSLSGGEGAVNAPIIGR